MKPVPFFLLKARAEQIPLRDNSVSLVIATPPYLGAKRARQKDCSTYDPEQYRALLARFLRKASRTVKPGGHILLHTNEPPVLRIGTVIRIVFKVFEKRARGGQGAHRSVASETFKTRYRRLKGFWWLAFPIRVYLRLIRRYSRPGETVVHVFSGSGQGAIAALRCSRKPVLLDVHYHRQTRRRINRRIKGSA